MSPLSSLKWRIGERVEVRVSLLTKGRARENGKKERARLKFWPSWMVIPGMMRMAKKKAMRKKKNNRKQKVKRHKKS